MPPTPVPSPTIYVQLSGGGEGAPWFGVPLIAGGFLVLGTVLGYILNRLQDKRRARQDLEVRYLDQRLEASSTVLREATWVRDLVRKTGWPAPGAVLAPPAAAAVAEAKNEIKAHSESAAVAHTSMLLIASEVLLQPTRNLYGAILYARTIDDNVRAQDCREKLDRDIKKFREACRKHFGAE